VPTAKFENIHLHLVAHIGELTSSYTILVGKSEGKNCSEDLGVDGKIMLEWIIRKKGGKVWWTGCIWLRMGTSGRLL